MVSVMVVVTVHRFGYYCRASHDLPAVRRMVRTECYTYLPFVDGVLGSPTPLEVPDAKLHGQDCQANLVKIWLNSNSPGFKKLGGTFVLPTSDDELEVRQGRYRYVSFRHCFGS